MDNSSFREKNPAYSTDKTDAPGFHEAHHVIESKDIAKETGWVVATHPVRFSG
jgi:hypothetical protein